MNKADFLSSLAAGLSGLSAREAQMSLDFYSEMIDDRMEDGMSEAEAVAALGTVEDIVREIYMEKPLPVILKSKQRRGMQGWEIALLILGSPLWLPLLLVLVPMVFLVYLMIWLTVAMSWLGMACVLLSGVLCVGTSVVQLFKGDLAQALFLLGSGLVVSPLGVLWFYGNRKVTEWGIGLTFKFGRVIKRMFVRKAVF